LADRLDGRAFSVDADLALEVAEFLRLASVLLDSSRIVDGADHGGAHARSAGAPTGAALATPHE
jgi:hypothetical protein